MSLEQILKNKENKRYAKSELVGFVASYGLATLTTVLLNYCNVSDLANVLGTYAAKTAGFMAGKVLSHGREYSKLIWSNLTATAVNATFQLGLHYALIGEDFVPYYLAPFVAYSVPGVISTGYRWWQDYKEKIVLNDPKSNGTNAGV